MALKSIKVTVNSTVQTLTYNSSTGKYEGQMTAPSKSSFNQSGGYYAITVVAEDEAGNTTTVNPSTATIGDNLKLTVKESDAPVINITYPTSNQVLTNNLPTFKFTVTDNDSGVDITKPIVVYFDDNKSVSYPVTSYTAINNGYSCEYVHSNALSDGTHKFTIYAFDHDGNSTEKTVSFTIDTTPPELSVTSPTDNLVTKSSTVTVAGTTNDITSSPVTLTVNGSEVTVDSNGNFSTVVSLTANASNTITIKATDAAGKETTITRTVYCDQTAPTISEVSITPNPVNTGSVFTISVTASDS